MKSVLITGCSSGFGLETAAFFLEQGWRVIATMRKPDSSLLPESEFLTILELDVTSAQSIQRAVELAGHIDVLVNNAGIGMLSSLEGTSMEVCEKLFATNVLGTIALIKAFLPQFRTRREGVIINVTSSVTVRPLPLLSVYSGTKAAVNAFTESLNLELKPFNIRSHLVLPGASPSTRFGENAMTRMDGSILEPYEKLTHDVIGHLHSLTQVTYAKDVAKAVWNVAMDENSPMYTAAGADAIAEMERSRSKAPF